MREEAIQDMLSRFMNHREGASGLMMVLIENLRALVTVL